jgi:Bacterial capsule synthesis protein PGA_cap
MNPRIRDRLLTAFFTVAALALGGTVTASYWLHENPPVETVSLDAAPTVPGRLSLQFGGDTMLADAAQEFINLNGHAAMLQHIAPLLDGDVVIANAEAPISDQMMPFNPNKEFNYNVQPPAAAALGSAGVDVLGLANNHAMDMGLAGLQDTARYAAASGMRTFGAGANRSEAERPLLVRSEAGTVGIVALGEDFGRTTATDTAPGTVALNPRTIQRGHDLARAAGADWVVAYVHWGDNYAPINADQRRWAQMLVDAGYDLIVGSGPHIVQPVEFIGNVPVAYSLGNLAFGTGGRFDNFGVEGTGLLLSLQLAADAPAQMAFRCIVTDNEVVGFVPVPCSEEQTRNLMLRVNPAITVEGNIGRLPVDRLQPTS